MYFKRSFCKIIAVSYDLRALKPRTTIMPVAPDSLHDFLLYFREIVHLQNTSGGCGTNYTDIDILMKANVPEMCCKAYFPVRLKRIREWCEEKLKSNMCRRIHCCVDTFRCIYWPFGKRIDSSLQACFLYNKCYYTIITYIDLNTE